MAQPDYEAMEGFEPPRVLKDGDELFSVPTNPWCDGCEGTEWDAIEDGRRCKSCGETYRTETRHVRELRPDQGYVRVQRVVEIREATGDERPVISICTGPDDQRPEHDPTASIYRPICVAQHMSLTSGGIYTYLKYCGHCRHKWGDGLAGGSDWLLCPYCGVTIGHYVFADGVEDWHPDPNAGFMEPGSSPPEVWPG